MCSDIQNIIECVRFKNCRARASGFGTLPSGAELTTDTGGKY